MKGKTVEVAPFDSYTYKVINRYNKDERHGPFDSVLEAKEYVLGLRIRGCWDYFTDTRNVTSEERESYWMYRIGLKCNGRIGNSVLRRPYIIVNQFGDIVPFGVIQDAGRKPYRNKNWEARCEKANRIESGLVKKKGDGNKIKREWAYRESWSNYSQEKTYTNDSFGYFRRISTKAERRDNTGCDADYGPGLVRASRRNYNLPSSWDDISCGAWHKRACWKHNSKRRKQWKPK